MNECPTPIKQKPLVVFLFHFLIFLYPLLSFLWRGSYPFTTVEVAVFILLIAAFCCLLALVLTNVRPQIVNLLSPVLFTIALMLQFNLLLIGAMLTILFGLVLAWQLGTKFQIYGLPVIAALILGAFFDSFEDEGYMRSSEEKVSLNVGLPPVLHILLDSFIGIDGLPAYPASKILSSEMYRFFGDYDFLLYPRAYSRFSSTGDSLYSALNFSNKSESKFGLEELGRRKHVLGNNSLFDVMQRIGYQFNVYQTGHIDFCQSNSKRVNRCWEYAQPNIESIQSASSLQTKLKMLTKALIGQSAILSDLVMSRSWIQDQGIATYDPRIFAELENDLFDGSLGEYYFAHVLLPHGPFAFDYDCSINYSSPAWARYANLESEPVRIEEVYEIRTMKYFAQVDCAIKSVGQIFDKMKKAGIFDQSIIVVHGDHGSMIGKFRPEYKNLEVLTPVEYRSHFSTLFAVKFPGNQVRIDDRTLPLSTLLEEFATTVDTYTSGGDEFRIMRNLSDTPQRTDPFVYLQGVSPMWKVDVNIFED